MILTASQPEEGERSQETVLVLSEYDLKFTLHTFAHIQDVFI
jgi:histidinol phosphatase-like PHP family hydrolase